LEERGIRRHRRPARRRLSTTSRRLMTATPPSRAIGPLNSSSVRQSTLGLTKLLTEKE